MKEKTEAMIIKNICNTIIQFTIIVVIMMLIALLFLMSACSNKDTKSESLEYDSDLNKQVEDTYVVGTPVVIESNKSDIMKDEGFDVKLGDVRFPMPTTLDELGPEWRFDEGNLNEQHAWIDENTGLAVEIVGNYYTTEWFFQGTDKKSKGTTVELCFNGRGILTAYLKDFDPLKDDVRKAKISGISFSYKRGKNEENLVFTVNGIKLNDSLSEIDPILKSKMKHEEWAEGESYGIKIDDMMLRFVSRSLDSVEKETNSILPITDIYISEFENYKSE